jgi:glyoxylase-like metal-dependent hydrolase (beta-lactamase superfamily II)
MFVKQVEVSSMAIFAYIVGCEKTKDALVIDPSADTERLINEAQSRGYTIKYIVNTHSHADHTMGNLKMKELTGAKIIIHENDVAGLIHQPLQMIMALGGDPSPPADITVKDGDLISIGETSLLVLHTPGHSPGGMCLYHTGIVFTGDTLFVGAVGRTDLGGGSFDVLSSSIHKKLFTLPDDTIVAPGHNYGDAPKSTIGKEKVYNPYVGQRAGY